MDYRSHAAPLLLSAMALIGGYSEASSHSHSEQCRHALSRNVEVEVLAREVSMLTQGWRELEGIFTDALSLALKNSMFSRSEFSKTTELVHAVRTLEDSLKAAQPPLELVDQHQDFRRAVAAVRGRLVQMESLHKQATVLPAYVDSDIDFNGLRMLADITTARLAKIA